MRKLVLNTVPDGVYTAKILRANCKRGWKDETKAWGGKWRICIVWAFETETNKIHVCDYIPTKSIKIEKEKISLYRRLLDDYGFVSSKSAKEMDGCDDFDKIWWDIQSVIRDKKNKVTADVMVTNGFASLLNWEGYANE